MKPVLTVVIGMWAVLLGACGGGGGGEVGLVDDASLEAATISTDATYRIRIAGEGGFGGVPSGEPFQCNATLVIRPGIPDGTQNNGDNPIDIAIYTDEMPVVGYAGALWFTSDTSLSTLFGSNLSDSSFDVSFVTLDEQNATVEVRLDGDASGQPRARPATVNIYNAYTSLTAQVHRALNGFVTLEFIAAGESVSGLATVKGRIELGGSSGFFGPFSSSEYIAEFEGELSS